MKAVVEMLINAWGHGKKPFLGFVRGGFVVLGLVAILAGCGFHPLYSRPPDGTLTDLGDVWISTISNREGQLLRNTLLTLFTPHGAPRHPKYVLTITLKDSQKDLAILRDATSSQTEHHYTAHVVLKDRATGAEKLKTTAQATVVYNVIPANPFSTLTEARAAKNRAVDSLAYDIRNQIAAFFLLKDQIAEGSLQEQQQAQGVLQDMFDAQKATPPSPPLNNDPTVW